MLVDMDVTKRFFDEVLVEWESYAFNVEVAYERMPMFCTHCRIIGHNVSYCKWLNPTDDEKVDHVKKKSEAEAPKKGKQQWAERILVPQEVLESWYLKSWYLNRISFSCWYLKSCYHRGG